MDDKIISAIQEYKNKQKKYNSKLKEDLKKEVLDTPPPKNKSSTKTKEQELEELRKELDLLNDLDNFDHLPDDPITDKDSPSYDEYDEYLIIKKSSQQNAIIPIDDLDEYFESETDTKDNNSLNDLDNLVDSLELNSSIQESIENEVITASEDDPFNDLDNLSNSLESTNANNNIKNNSSPILLEIDSSIEQKPDNVIKDSFFENLNDQANFVESETSTDNSSLSIQEYTPDIVAVSEDNPFNDLDNLVDSLEPVTEEPLVELDNSDSDLQFDLPIQNSIEEVAETIIEKNSLDDLGDLVDSLEPITENQLVELDNVDNDIQSEIPIQNKLEEVIEITVQQNSFDDLDNLVDSLEPNLSIEQSIQEPLTENHQDNPLQELDDLTDSFESDFSNEENVQSNEKNDFTSNSNNSTIDLEDFDSITENTQLDDLDKLENSFEADLSSQNIVEETTEINIQDDQFTELENLTDSITSEVSNIDNSFDDLDNTEFSDVETSDNVEQTIEYLDQLAETVDTPVDNQTIDLMQQIYQTNASTDDNKKSISLYLEESNTENSILESDLHFSLEAELNSLNESFPINEKEAEPPKFVIQEPKIKNLDKPSVLAELDNIPQFQDETKDYIKLDKKIPITDNPPLWTDDDQLLKTLEFNRENRIIKAENDKIFAAISFLNPKLFKNYLYPDIELDKSLLIADFFINKSNDFFDFHFITVQLSFLIDMKFILHQMIHYTNEKYSKDQSEPTRIKISKLNSFEFKLHKFIHKLAISASKENVPTDIKSLLKNRHALEAKVLNKEEFLFFLEEKIHINE